MDDHRLATATRWLRLLFTWMYTHVEHQVVHYTYSSLSASFIFFRLCNLSECASVVFVLEKPRRRAGQTHSKCLSRRAYQDHLSLRHASISASRPTQRQVLSFLSSFLAMLVKSLRWFGFFFLWVFSRPHGFAQNPPSCCEQGSACLTGGT